LIKDSQKSSNPQTLHFDSLVNGFLRFVKSYDKQTYIENSEFILQIL